MKMCPFTHTSVQTRVDLRARIDHLADQYLRGLGVEFAFLILGAPLVVACHLLVGSKVSFPPLRISSRTIRHPRAIRVKREKIDGHESTIPQIDATPRVARRA